MRAISTWWFRCLLETNQIISLDASIQRKQEKYDQTRRVAIHERRVGFVRMVSYFEFLGNESNDIVCTTHVFTKSSL